MASDKESSTVRLSISMPKEDREMIESEASRQRISKSGLIRSIVLPEIERREAERDDGKRVPA